MAEGRIKLTIPLLQLIEFRVSTWLRYEDRLRYILLVPLSKRTHFPSSHIHIETPKRLHSFGDVW